MQISVILAHPSGQSLNHAIVQTAVAERKQNGHQNGMLGFCGFPRSFRKKFSGVVTSTMEHCQAWLAKERKTPRRCFSKQ